MLAAPSSKQPLSINGAFLRGQSTPTPKSNYTDAVDAIVNLVREVENAIEKKDTRVWNTGDNFTRIRPDQKRQLLDCHPLDKDLAARLKRPVAR